ncbi:hypothetical protein XK97_12170 [Obesumbacterium proteus]|uniref:hypothetical protein n=1 Tax=Obesumbacterium proteus TaxID=82983 RepID=UPI00062264F2|nr:hypothetical protein [Obesumbacterium proteus]KKI46733.1 hypothetical protein XK97_12170 [Obesumbacterium proteus]
MSQQKVYGNVGQMIGRDIVVNYNNVAQEKIDAPIEHSQRVQLNVLLNDIANLTSGSKKIVWHRLHTTMHVNNQNSSENTQWSESFLLFENKKFKAINSRNIIIRKIQQITNTPEKKSQRNKLCLDIFGTSTLAHLTLEQLQSVYYFIGLGFSLCEIEYKTNTEKMHHFFNPVYDRDIKPHKITQSHSLINIIYFILGCIMGFISIIIAKIII